jgi:hypothetical protein
LYIFCIFLSTLSHFQNKERSWQKPSLFLVERLAE